MAGNMHSEATAQRRMTMTPAEFDSQTDKRLAACKSVLSRGRRDQNKGSKVWFVVKGTHDFMLNLEEDIAQCA